MIRKPTDKEIERLEEASQKDENNLSNLGLATHYVKGIGVFTYRLVCEFIPVEQHEKDNFVPQNFVPQKSVQNGCGKIYDINLVHKDGIRDKLVGTYGEENSFCPECQLLEKNIKEKKNE